MLYGLIGRKLGHSFSARFFNEKFEAEGIPARYELFEMPSVMEVPDLLSSHADLCGFNVTIPYKQDIIPYLSAVSDSARRIGAVNAVRVLRQSEPKLPGSPRYILEGTNTDAPGFRDALLPLLGSYGEIKGMKALVLGTGGASKAVVYALEELGIMANLVSRHPSPGQLGYEDLSEEVIASHKLIVNSTPLGMWPDVEACPPIPYERLTPGHLCFDLIYNPEVTEFMRRASERGARVSNGMRMLINQALLAWEFWQAPRSRKYLSRQVEIHRPDGSVESHSLSIAEIRYNPDGSIQEVNVSPFSEEIHSVEYLDHPLILHLS